MTECGRLSTELGVRVLLKREDLAHTGSHKLNNVIGQGLLARRMGKSRLIAETGAGQHGVATATAAALFGMECVVYMGEVDIQRQELNVFRMELLGAEVRPVSSGSRTLKDAVNEALRDWVASVADTHYCLGSVMGPHPYPWMVREFQRVIGDEARDQCRALLDGDDPDVVVACAGGGSNAAGIFAGFADGIGLGPGGGRGGRGRGHDHGHPRGPPRHAQRAHAGRGRPDPRGQVHLGRPRLPGHRARARPSGRRRPGPLRDGRATGRCSRPSSAWPGPRGSSPPSSRPTPWPGSSPMPGTPALPSGSTVLVNLSGRGDKDVAQVRDLLRSDP